ncbi:serine hydrolase domain-containing protein [Rhodococcoides kyotonense]|uniref:D-alanyl-D-alanine carboxypeptidase n=1 Tax=Rhodococcoides kyotonense TaxID=398843 RepID=A0A239FJH0_9NOCA|nr:serine hydrolase domain-containing protein [Rhodococcus kyotonensis]SNS56907.1 D-alanyl-D-alanine carboxypeptidase [Rhodococcus kyotonensis]
MRRRSTSIVLGAVFVLVIAAGCSSSSESSDSTGTASATASSTASTTAEASYVADLQPKIEKAMSDNVIPGAVVVVESPTEGNWTGTFGTQVIGEDRPVSVDDYFRIGSNTKTMTSTVILQLAQEGKIGLDDPIAKYQDGVPNGDRITIAQLSDMHSGLYSYSFDPAFNTTLDNDPQKAWTPDELLAIAFSHPVNFEPGAKFEYSNTNIVLLGLVIEKVTGMPAAEALQQRIFEPLGMTHTSLPDATDASIPTPHPQGYSFGTNVSTIDTFALPEPQQSEALVGTLKPNDETDANPSWTWTAGGAISTVDDMVTYTKALVGGGLLDEGMQKTRLDSIQPIEPQNPDAAGYGLGIARFGPALIGHDGQIPGFTTVAVNDPATDLTIVIATNLATVPTGEGSALVLLKAMIPTFYGEGAVTGGNPASVPEKTGGQTSGPSLTTPETAEPTPTP